MKNEKYVGNISVHGRKNKFWLVVRITAGAVVIICAVLLVSQNMQAPLDDEQSVTDGEQSVTDGEQSVTDGESSPILQATPYEPTLAPTAEVSPTFEPTFAPEEPTATPVVLPAEYVLLKEKYPDIFAWIQFTEAGIDLPVVHHEDDSYYLKRDLDGKSSAAGTVYSERTYNSSDFTDPVTILYGHNMKDGAMFGSLQKSTATLDLREDITFDIYTPDEKLSYKVFACVPYSNIHVLHYNDFNIEYVFSNFFDNIFLIRSLRANLDEDSRPQFGDRVVILSTCLMEDNTQRYLVMGKLIVI